MIDLHIHTKYSDGDLTIEQLIALAKEFDLNAISKTDHNTIAGTKELVAAAKDTSLKIIPGVELTTKYKLHDKYIELHLLGYFVQYKNIDFVNKLNEYLERLNKFELDLRLPWLKKTFPRITEQDVLSFTDGVISGSQYLLSVKKYHEYKSILRQSGVLYYKGGQEKYNTYLFYTNFCKPQNTKDTSELLEGSPIMEIEKAIQFLLEFGVIPVIAHFPIDSLDVSVMDGLVERGVKGLELANSIDYHRTEKKRKLIIEYAEKNDLLLTIGSDYHGQIKPHIPYEIQAPELDHEYWLERLYKKVNY